MPVFATQVIVLWVKGTKAEDIEETDLSLAMATKISRMQILTHHMQRELHLFVDVPRLCAEEDSLIEYSALSV